MGWHKEYVYESSWIKVRPSRKLSQGTGQKNGELVDFLEDHLLAKLVIHKNLFLVTAL